MVNINTLNEIISRCRFAGYDNAARRFNAIRGRLLGRAYCDFTYECMQVIDDLKQETKNNRFASELRILVRD